MQFHIFQQNPIVIQTQFDTHLSYLGIEINSYKGIYTFDMHFANTH